MAWQGRSLLELTAQELLSCRDAGCSGEGDCVSCVPPSFCQLLWPLVWEIKILSVILKLRKERGLGLVASWL